MVIDELHHAQDFAALYSCALTCRRFAPLALSGLYRIHSESPNSDEADDGQDVALQALQKWSISWRSIILSTMKETAYPYFSYLRFLDLRDLGNMLDDEKLSKRIQRKLFQGKLSKLLMEKQHMMRKGPVIKLDVMKIVEAVGDIITPKASLLLEQLSGECESHAIRTKLVIKRPILTEA